MSAVDRVRPLLTPCRLCEVRCDVDRLGGAVGPCGAGIEARVYNAFLHHGEEPPISPSFAVFLTGCNFRCSYCSDGLYVDDPGRGLVLDPGALGQALTQAPGAKSVQFVGGLADVNLLAVAACVEALPPTLPVVLNTNAYFTPEALEAMTGWVDWLLADVKYGPGGCARELSEIDAYFSTVTANLLRAHALGFSLMVRHLLLPGHLSCCTKPVVDWLSNHLPEIPLNLMSGYQPLHRARGLAGPLGGRLAPADLLAARAYAQGAALTTLWLDGRPVNGMASPAAAGA